MKYPIVLVYILFALASNGQTSTKSYPHEEPIDKKIKVYLLGTFHFAQTDDDYNVKEQKHQESIKELCDIIQKQNPDKIFVERQPEFEFKSKIDSLFQAYTKGRELKPKGEMYQIGFRVAKELGHKKVYQCDNPGQYGKYYRQARDYAAKNDQMDILEAKRIGTVKRYDNIVNEDSVMQNSTLLEYIQWINSEQVMQTSHAHYIANYPQIGSTDFYNYDDDDTLIGAELTADWYRRNIMIYTKMICQLDYKEDAIFLLMGADHIPIIKNLFDANPYFEVINPREWLKSNNP
ncbi:MAG: hypothetical protein HRU40_04750 [Saprospiraceae bacterium]|nr:hypothetical protein [Saprospiraceae bacterium]